MNKKELIEKLNTIEDRIDGDAEDYHSEADKLLLEFINDKDITYAFGMVPKWYA